ncbi:tenascin [Salarias fasciatus]|uniref:Tenascin-like n=1 Tax=Salarias fasciatus TaxID=181472 RepID=A0A672GS54_SALFA|nr:tenascin-like [Salarias fasciatus]
MLFTLGLLLLLTPFPSFQTTTNEKRGTTGSDVTKPNAVFTLSKPKTTAALAKQTIIPTPKASTLNQTVLATPAPNQKPSTVDSTLNAKGKSSSPASNVQLNSTRSAPATSAKTTRDKPQHAVNQTSGADTKMGKDKPAPSTVQNVQSTAPRSGTTSGTKNIKTKPTGSMNQTAVAKTSHTSDVKTKDKPAATKVLTGKVATAGGSASDKAAVDQTVLVKAPSTTNTKDKPAPSQPIKVVISDGCESSSSKEQELKLKPGAPLVMTHKISLLPGGCTGGCEAEMAALKGRVARLEQEMSALKNKCPCSANCPNDCSGNGECEKGKCVCQQGFMGADCSKCVPGVECQKKLSKGKPKITVETMTLQKNKENMQEKTTRVEQTLFQKKKVSDTKGTDTKATNTKAGVPKTQAKQDTSVKKTTTKSSSSATKTSRPTVGQVLLRHDGRKQEEAKTAILSTKKVVQKSDSRLVKEGAGSKTTSKADQLKDDPRHNVTQSNLKKSNGTSKIVTILTKVTGANKTTTVKEQSTLAEKNITQSSGQKQIKVVKVDTTDNRKTEIGRGGRGKIDQKSQYIVNTTFTSTSDETKALQDKTSIHGSGVNTRKTGGSGLGSVRAVNISSYSFTVTWSAPQGMFKNFTVVRRETQANGEENEREEFEEEVLDAERLDTAKNATDALVQIESINTTASSGKTAGSRGKAEARRISMVVPGSVRNVEFSNLRANTRYVLHVYGTTAERRSKIHRVIATTGPEPATEMVFSNVTESSLTVSWTKPKTVFTGFRVTYTNIITGESHWVMVASQQSSVTLSKLSAGSSYVFTVSATHGQAQSDMLTGLMTTVPAPPTHLQVVNVTDTRALLQWTPSLGKVDRFIVSYESSKTPNVTVTVMLSGNSVEHQLRGLQRGTLYTVKVLSEKDSLQSMAIATTFTTANVVKASEVNARSALLTWRTTVVYHSYRVIYQVVGEEPKELFLEPSITEYKLTGLLPMSRYIVLVQGEINGHYTSIVTTEFITGKLRFPYPTECSQELLNGALQSGEVDIYPQGKEAGAVRVYCDMETDGGGWTVFQRRMNGKTDFYRTWSEYRAGFGNLSEEFWLGNELLHDLTSVGPVSLRVDMQSGNHTAYAHYSDFAIDSEERQYALTVSGYTGTAGDSMRYHNGRPFSTRDKDPDPLGIHCARAYMGGWWYKNCYKTNLNGLYGTNSDNQGVVWIDWKGKDSSIPFTEMKFRPSRFSPATHG